MHRIYVAFTGSDLLSAPTFGAMEQSRRVKGGEIPSRRKDALLENVARAVPPLASRISVGGADGEEASPDPTGQETVAAVPP